MAVMVQFSNEVAPLVGAWIEIYGGAIITISDMSLPSWERGLKFESEAVSNDHCQSLPSWERGLKSFT